MPSKSSAKPRVLIIEDQEGFRRIFKDILEHGGYEVLEAEDGEKGWKLIRTAKPNLILLDLMLPKLDGFEVLEHMKLDPLTCNIPVVIISVLEEPEKKQKVLSLGAKGYLVKSELSISEILERVAEFFD